MPVILTPHVDDPTILIIRIMNPWNWADMQQANQTIPMTPGSDYASRIDRIVDLLDNPSLPHDSLNAARYHLSDFPDSWGISVVVATDQNILQMFETFRRIFPAFSHRIYVTSSIDDAIDIIKAHRKLTSPHPDND